MKALFGKYFMMLVMLAAPALADGINTTVSFTNQGNTSGDLATGAVYSNVNSFTSTEGVVGPGDVGVINLKTGVLTGSISAGGTFDAGVMNFTSKGSTVYGNKLKGTWTKLASGQYQLVGQFFGARNGIKYTGVTTQQFSYTGGHYVVVSGITTINASN